MTDQKEEPVVVGRIELMLLRELQQAVAEMRATRGRDALTERLDRADSQWHDFLEHGALRAPVGRCLFFGCWGQPGHCLIAPSGTSRTGLPSDEAWALAEALDGAFAPRRGRDGAIVCGNHYVYEGRAYGTEECAQGEFLRHRLGKWSLLQWWDRCQGDTRGACNSTILLEGERTTAELLQALETRFPSVLENLKQHGVKLVDVTDRFEAAKEQP